MSEKIIRNGITYELTAEEVSRIVSGYMLKTSAEDALYPVMSRYSALMDKWFGPDARAHAEDFPDPWETSNLQALRKEGGWLFEHDPILRLCELFHYLFVHRIAMGAMPERSSLLFKIIPAVIEIENDRKYQIRSAVRRYKQRN